MAEAISTGLTDGWMKAAGEGWGLQGEGPRAAKAQSENITGPRTKKTTELSRDEAGETGILNTYF